MKIVTIDATSGSVDGFLPPRCPAGIALAEGVQTAYEHRKAKIYRTYVRCAGENFTFRTMKSQLHLELGQLSEKAQLGLAQLILIEAASEDDKQLLLHFLRSDGSGKVRNSVLATVTGSVHSEVIITLHAR